MIRTVFLGTPEFAVPSLAALVEEPDIEIPLVVTQPDRRAGRGRSVRPPAVKQAAESLSLPVFQPESLRGQDAIAQIERARPDVIVVVSYGEILRRSILDLPPHGCLNVHPSLLPAYRGSAPIPAAILNGDRETGVSIMRLVRKMDAGPVIEQTRQSLDGTETAGELAERLAHLAAEQLPATVRRWVAGELVEHPQDESQASYTRELRKSDARVDWSNSSTYIERFVRAMDPWPRAWTALRESRLALHRVRPLADPAPDVSPGMLSSDGGSVYVGTGDGQVELLTVQPGGKKPMPASDWLRGARITDGTVFDPPDEEPSPLIFRR